MPEGLQYNCDSYKDFGGVTCRENPIDVAREY
jgi:hypothetical protein